MRVLFLNPIGRIGGGERVLLDLLTCLGEMRPSLERHLLLLEDGPLAQAARDVGVDVAVLPAGTALRTMGDSGLRAGGRAGGAVALAMRGLLAGPALWRLVRQLRRHIDRV